MKNFTEEGKFTARKVFEATGNISKASKASNIRRATISAWIARENWTVQVPPGICTIPPTDTVQTPVSDDESSRTVHRTVRSRVIDFTTRKAIEQVEASGTVQAHVDYVAASLEAHGRVASNLLVYAEELLAQARAGEVYIPKMQSQADFANALASMVQRAIAISRDVAGLKAGQASAATNADADAPIRIEQRRLEPFRFPVDEKGRIIDADAA